MRARTPHPVHPDRLEGSAWTSRSPDHPYAHYEVVAFRKKRGEVELMATLDRSSRVVAPWRELRDRSRWEPGWGPCERTPVNKGEEE